MATGRILVPSASEITKSRGVDKDFFKVRNYVSSNRDKGRKCNRKAGYFYELKDLVRYPLHIDCIHYKIKTRVNTR